MEKLPLRSTIGISISIKVRIARPAEAAGKTTAERGGRFLLWSRCGEALRSQQNHGRRDVAPHACLESTALPAALHFPLLRNDGNQRKVTGKQSHCRPPRDSEEPLGVTIGDNQRLLRNNNNNKTQTRLPESSGNSSCR